MKNLLPASQPKLFPTAPMVACGPTRFDLFKEAELAKWSAEATSFVTGSTPYCHKIEFCQNCNGWHVLVTL